MIYSQLVLGVIHSYFILFMTVSWAITLGFMTSPTRRIGRTSSFSCLLAMEHKHQ